MVERFGSRMEQSYGAGKPRRWPVPPSLLIGLAPLAAFAAWSVWRSRPSDDYAQLGLTVDSVVRALVLPEAIAAGVLALLVTALGWWRIATVDPVRGRPVWTVLAPGLIVVLCLARFPLFEWGARPLRYFLLLALGTLLVGVFEELMTRGVLLVGLRRRLPEFWVWIVSCALFGLMHLLNILAGGGVGTTLVQVVFAASFGSTLYLARRLTRSLAVPVLIHGLWDFTSIGLQATGLDAERITGGGFDGRVAWLGLLGLTSFAVLALGVVAGGIVAWRDDRGPRLRRRWRTVPPRDAGAGGSGDQRLPAGPGGTVPVAGTGVGSGAAH